MALIPGLSTAAADVTAIFDAEFNRVLRDADIITASVSEPSLFFDQPLENSTVSTDHIIFLPVEISIPMILPAAHYRDLYQQIKDFRNNATPLFVQMKTGSYGNMLIQDIPHDEDPERFDVIAITLILREVQGFNAAVQALSADAVQNPADQSTVDKGAIQPKEPNASLAAQALNTLGGFF